MAAIDVLERRGVYSGEVYISTACYPVKYLRLILQYNT